MEASYNALLREYRQRAGLSQQELAERAGISLAAVRDLEQGRTRQPRPRSMRALADALGLHDDAAAALYSAATPPPEPALVRPVDGAVPHTLRLKVLGPLTVHRGPVEVALGRGGRRALLARLALSVNAPVPVHDLVELLWGDRPPPEPNQLLQAHMSRLRSALQPAGSGPAIDSMLSLVAGGYRLALADEQLDLTEFRRLVRLARQETGADALELLERALNLWRGTPLVDVVEVRDHPVATALVEERVAVALGHADLAAALGQPDRSLPFLRELTAAHPLHEPLHARLVAALAGAGLQADALALCDDIRRRLADELGIDPGPELTEIHRRVLRQEVPAGGGSRVAGLRTSVPAQLPAVPGPFVGRRGELDQLDKLLEAGLTERTVVISAVSGMAGVGKTTLAVHWARRVAGQFPDGQLYVNLRGFDRAGTAATPAEVVRWFLDALEVPPQRVPAGLDAQTALYRTLLSERRMLVLLDNARDVEQVRPLLAGTSSCLVLITSRNQLTGLVAGAGAIPLPLDLLNPDEARDLLAQRVGVDRIAAEPAAVEEIIDRCGRLPLALAIVAARAATQPQLTLTSLAAELRHLYDRLDTLATGDPGTDVRSVFSWSYQQLSQPAARLFRLLGVHPGPDLSASAAASLAGIPPARVRPLLTELIRAHLITERVPGRYVLHDLLRAYADELAGSCDPEADRQAVVHRLLDHYLRCAFRADTVLDPARDVIELIAPQAGVTVDDVESAGGGTDWFTAEYPVLMAAVRLAVDTGLDRHAWQLVWSMSTFIARHRGFRDAIALHQIALRAAERLRDLAAQGYSHRRLGQTYALRGEGDEAQAQAHLEHALEVYRQLGDDTNQAQVHLGLAFMLERQGLHRDTLHQAEQALAGFQTSSHRAGQANALNAVGWCHAQLGDYGTALAYCEQALGLQQELGDRPGEAVTWDSLGVVYHNLGRYADAAAAYQQALALLRDHGDRYYEAHTLVHLGDTHETSGDTDAARDRWRAALAILTDLDHPDAEQVRTRLRDGDERDLDVS